MVSVIVLRLPPRGPFGAMPVRRVSDCYRTVTVRHRNKSSAHLVVICHHVAGPEDIHIHRSGPVFGLARSCWRLLRPNRRICINSGSLREPEFIHIHRFGLRSLQLDRAKPKTGPDRCLCISSGPSGILPMGLAATAHSSLGPQAGPAGCTAESCLAEAGTRVPAHASGQSPSWRRLLCT